MSTPYNPAQSGPRLVTPGSGSGTTIDSSDISRILPRQLSIGTLRGTQSVGYGGVKIDGSNDIITLNGLASSQQSTVLSGTGLVVTNPDGSSSGMGAIPNTSPQEYGFFSLDISGNLIMKIVNGTWYVNDPTNNTNVMQSGILPDESIGWAVASSGNSVADGFS